MSTLDMTPYDTELLREIFTRFTFCLIPGFSSFLIITVAITVIMRFGFENLYIYKKNVAGENFWLVR